MKLDRVQVSVLLVTALLLTAVIGYRAGSGNSEASFSVSVQRQASVSDVMRGGDETDADQSGGPVSDGTIEGDTDPATASPRIAGSDELEIPDVSGPININIAGLEELKQLPGIGDVLASRILEYREENGGFTDISDLLEIKGIGVAIYDKIKPLVNTGGGM